MNHFSTNLAQVIDKKINKERQKGEGKKGRKGKGKMGVSKGRKDKNMQFCCLAEKKNGFLNES